MDQTEVDALAHRVWDYLLMHHQLEKADCILALGSHDIRVAQRGATLFLEGWAPLLIFSGGLGRLTSGIWTRPEAEVFADAAIQMGVPAERILIENKSTDTGENIQFTRRLLQEKGLDPEKFIVVQKPYMERRAFATFKKRWPEKQLVVTSPQLSFDEYANAEISTEEIIHIMLGDLQRIKLYAAKGYQIYQEIPAAVWDAYLQLAAAGYTNQLIEQ